MARAHLDISIKNLEKFPHELKLHDHVLVTEKVDGVKLTIIRNHEPWQCDATKNWIVSYKSNLINPEDFLGLQSKHDNDIRAYSTGISQYKLVWDHLKCNHVNARHIPCGTELFIEFVMRKGTLTRVYEHYHAMILIASSPSSWRIQSGKVFSSPETFDVSHNAEYACMLGMRIAPVLYNGPVAGMTVAELKTCFLSMPSEFGGKMEGVVIRFPDNRLYKLVQPDQHDKAVRALNRAAFEPHDATNYWHQVRCIACDYVAPLQVHADFKTNVSKLSHAVYDSLDLNLDANKKSINAKDDVFLTAKTMLMRATPGNNGALFLGRMSPMTTAHHAIISSALEKYDTVTVNLIKSRTDEHNPFPIELQQRMIDMCFGNKVELLTGTTGNLCTILQKSHHMINVVLAGTDRIEGYVAQLKHIHDVVVVETPRVNDVSGTRARSFIARDDECGFRSCTPQSIWPLFHELRSHMVTK